MQAEDDALDLYEHAPCGYISTDPDGLILRANRTFLELTGYRAEELVGRRRFQDLLTAGGRIYHETHYAPLLRMQGAVREIAVDVVRADGARLPALVNSVVKHGPDGAPLAIRTTLFEAADRRRYEQELLSARDRARTARARTDQLQRLSAALVAAPDTEAIARATTRALVEMLGAARARFAPVPADARPATPVFDEGGTDGRARAELPVGGSGAGGVIRLRYEGPRAFSDEERALALACARQATLALERARLYEEERDVAHALQRSMLGGAPPDDPRFDVAAYYSPAAERLEVGGDWYDWFPLPGGRVAVTVGDVVGRGLPAATAMGQLRSGVRALAAGGMSPASLLTHLDVFVDQVPSARYATLICAVLDPGAGTARVASAGHMPLLRLGLADGPALLMEGRSVPLGVPLAGERPEAELALRPGAGFLLYTDGLVERRGESIDDGLARLTRAVAAHGALPPAQLVERLAADLLEGRAGDDDVCILAVVGRR